MTTLELALLAFCVWIAVLVFVVALMESAHREDEAAHRAAERRRVEARRPRA